MACPSHQRASRQGYIHAHRRARAGKPQSFGSIRERAALRAATSRNWAEAGCCLLSTRDGAALRRRRGGGPPSVILERLPDRMLVVDGDWIAQPPGPVSPCERSRGPLRRRTRARARRSRAIHDSCIGWPTRERRGMSGAGLFVGEDDGQAALVTQHHDLGVGALGQLVGHLDGLPLEKLGLMPRATMVWKSAMPCPSTRLRSASWRSRSSTNFIRCACCSAWSFSWIAVVRSWGSCTARRRTCSASTPRGETSRSTCLNMFWATSSREAEYRNFASYSAVTSRMTERSCGSITTSS